MSIDENKLIVRRFIEEIINTGNIDKIENFISPDYYEVHERKKYHEHGGAANLFEPLLEIGAIQIVGDSNSKK